MSDKDQYLQINLGQLEPVYGVKIKGSPLYNEFVTSYKVLYSSDGVLYSYVTDKEKNPKVIKNKCLNYNFIHLNYSWTHLLAITWILFNLHLIELSCLFIWFYAELVN